MDFIVGVINELLNNKTYSIYLVYAIAGLAGITLAIALNFLYTGLFNPAKRRLSELRNKTATENDQDFNETLEHGLGSEHKFARHLLFDSKGSRKRLIHAGFHHNNALAVYNGIRLVSVLLMVFVSLAVLKATPEQSTTVHLYIVVVLLASGFLVPSLILDFLANKRMARIRSGFPDALDLMVVCCESGQSLIAAFQRVAIELSVSHQELAEELQLVCQKHRAGIELHLALNEFAERTGLDDIRGLNSAITQSLRLGTGIAQTLRVYSDEYRDKRLQAAEEMAAKLGVKIIFPMLTCIWPAFFIVAIGPSILKIMDVWDKAF